MWVNKMSKENCENCSYFIKLANIIGYCQRLSVATQEGVAIIATESIFSIVAKDMGIETIYLMPIVSCSFACAYYEKK